MEKPNYKEYILKHFKYENGALIRDDRKNSTGSYDKDGYLIIKVKGKQFKYHRIVWLLNYGDFPNGEIDHINRNKNDNRIENLRLATRKIQNQNKDFKPNKNTNVVGIYIDNTRGLKKKYSFKHNGKSFRFYTLEEAIKNKKILKEGI